MVLKSDEIRGFADYDQTLKLFHVSRFQAVCSESLEGNGSPALQSLFTPVICSWQVSDVGSLLLRPKEVRKKS